MISIRGAAGRTRATLTAVLLAVSIAYPVLVWIGLSNVGARTTALFLLAVAASIFIARSRVGRPLASRGLTMLPVLTAIVLASSAILDSAGLMLATPALVNGVALFAFGITLRRASIPMIERFARLQVAQPDASQRAWCRTWTWIWCSFFTTNIIVAMALALAAPLAAWALYNGLISYLLMGVLLVGEWYLRRRRFPDGGDLGPDMKFQWQADPAVPPLVSDDGSTRLLVRVPTELVYFQGHFPDQPILAGAVQLTGLVLPGLRRLRSDLGPVRAWKGLKFHSRIGPGDQLELVLQFGEDASSASFQILRQQRLCSSGQVLFGSGAAP